MAGASPPALGTIHCHAHLARSRRPLGILAIAAYGFWRGTPQDVVNAVRRGNVEAVRSALARDPANVHTKVYAQAYESLKSRSDYISRTGTTRGAAGF